MTKTYNVICAMPGQNAINTVSCYNIDAKSEQEAAKIACKKWSWLTVNVRKNNPVPAGELVKFNVYNNNGRLITQRY
jgi:hypothetical protein